MIVENLARTSDYWSFIDRRSSSAVQYEQITSQVFLDLCWNAETEVDSILNWILRNAVSES